MDKAVLTGQGEQSGAAPATVTAAAADHAVASTADPAAMEATAGSPAVAGATAVPGAGSGAVPVPPAAATAELPPRASTPRWANLPYAIVLALVAGGLAWVALGGLRHVQAGMMTVASALLVAAVLRLVLPERAVGLLGSRRRVLDVLALASLGAGIMAAVLVLPTP